MIIFAKKGRNNKRLLIIKNINKIAMIEVSKVLSIILLILIARLVGLLAIIIYMQLKI